MRLGFLAALAVSLALAAPAAAQELPQQRLAREIPERFVALPGNDMSWVDARATGTTLIVMPVLLDGMPVNALIDTGAPFSVIDRDFAFEHGYPVRRPAADRPGGQPTALATVPIRSLHFSGAERSGGQLRVANLSGFRLFGLDVPVILGNDFLSCCALQLDYERGRGRLLRSGARPIAGAEIPLRHSPGKDYFFTALNLGGKPIESIMVDTGGDGSLMLSEARWAAAGLPPPPTSIKLLVLSGTRVAGRAQLDALTLGSQTVRGIAATIVPGDAGLLKASDANGSIGTALLQRFHVVIDVGAGRMILGARATPLGPDRKITGGVQLTRDGDNVLIMHVLRNSPAERLGLVTGDRICSINGKPAVDAPRGWSMGMPGETWQLTLCDARMIALTLAEFY